MELAQSNPQMSEEDLDGDDDDVMKVFPNENAKDVTNLEGEEEDVTMQDIDGFILNQPGCSQLYYRGNNHIANRGF